MFYRHILRCTTMDQGAFVEAVAGASRVLDSRPRIPRITCEGELLVLGDLHGDYRILQKILTHEHVERRLEDDLGIVFLGDYVDRGPQSIETLYTVCRLVCDYPGKVTPLRGNHEGPPSVPAMPVTFYDHIKSSYPDNIDPLLMVRALFCALPVAAVLPDYAFMVHGHIPHDTTNLNTLSHLSEQDQTLIELLWNDPAVTPETHPSFRGQGYYVGTDAVDLFLLENNLRWVIRGHEKPENGYELMHKTFTIHTTGEKTTYLQIPLKKPSNPVNYVKQI